MFKTHFVRLGLTEAQIQEKLENLPELKTYSLGMGLDSPGEVQWEIENMVEIDWRIPMDVTRVMIFERLEYILRRKDILNQELIQEIKQIYFKKHQILKEQNNMAV